MRVKKLYNPDNEVFRDYKPDFKFSEKHKKQIHVEDVFDSREMKRKKSDAANTDDNMDRVFKETVNPDSAVSIKREIDNNSEGIHLKKHKKNKDKECSKGFELSPTKKKKKRNFNDMNMINVDTENSFTTLKNVDSLYEVPYEVIADGSELSSTKKKRKKQKYSDTNMTNYDTENGSSTMKITANTNKVNADLFSSELSPIKRKKKKHKYGDVNLTNYDTENSSNTMKKIANTNEVNSDLFDSKLSKRKKKKHKYGDTNMTNNDTENNSTLKKLDCKYEVAGEFCADFNGSELSPTKKKKKKYKYDDTNMTIYNAENRTKLKKMNNLYEVNYEISADFNGSKLSPPEKKHKYGDMDMTNVDLDFKSPTKHKKKHKKGKKNSDINIPEADANISVPEVILDEIHMYKMQGAENKNDNFQIDDDTYEGLTSKKKKKRHKKDEENELKDIETCVNPTNFEVNITDKKKKKHKKDKRYNINSGELCIDEINKCDEEMLNKLVCTDIPMNKEQLYATEGNLNVLFEKKPEIQDSRLLLTDDFSTNLSTSELSPVKHKKKHKKSKKNKDITTTNADTVIYEKPNMNNVNNDLQTNDVTNDFPTSEIISSKETKKGKNTEFKTQEACTVPVNLETIDLKKKKHKQKDKDRNFSGVDLCTKEINEQPILYDESASTGLIKNNEKLEHSGRDLSILFENDPEKNDNNDNITEEICVNYEATESSPTKHKKHKKSKRKSDISAAEEDVVCYESVKTSVENHAYNKNETNNIGDGLQTNDPVNDVDASGVISKKRKKKHHKKDKVNELSIDEEDVVCYESEKNSVENHAYNENETNNIDHDLQTNYVDDSEVISKKRKKKHHKKDKVKELSVDEEDVVCYESQKTSVENHAYNENETNNIDNGLQTNDVDASEVISNKRQKKHHKKDKVNELSGDTTCIDLEKRKKPKETNKDFNLITDDSYVDEIETGNQYKQYDLVLPDMTEEEKTGHLIEKIYNFLDNDTSNTCNGEFDTSDIAFSESVEKRNCDNYVIPENSEQSDSVQSSNDLDRSTSKKHKLKDTGKQSKNGESVKESHQSLILQYLDRSTPKKHKLKNTDKQSKNGENVKESHQSLILQSNSMVDTSSDTEDSLQTDDCIKSVVRKNQNLSKTKRTEKGSNFQSDFNYDEDPVDFEVPVLHQMENTKALTKETKKKLLENNVVIKTGGFTFKEDKIIKKNFEEFGQKYGISDPIELFGIGRYGCDKEMSKFIRAKHFYVRLGKGLNDRSLHSIYKRARRILHPSKTKSKLDEIGLNKLKKLNTTSSSKWNYIANALDREPDNCLQTIRWHKKNILKGEWSFEEENQLIKAIEKVSGSSELAFDKIKKINWDEVSAYVSTRNASQCRFYWALHLGWKSNSQKKKWDHSCYVKLLNILAKEWFVEKMSKGDWQKVHESFVDFAPTYTFLQKRWYYLKHTVPECTTKSDKEILRILCKKYDIDYKAK